MVFAFRNLRIVAEPGGAVALAALISGKAGDVPDGSVVIVSGGNVDSALYAELLGNGRGDGGRMVPHDPLGSRSRG